MKKSALVPALAAAALALPATAAAGRTVSGVVVAKDPARAAAVVALRGGEARTIRLTGRRLAALRLGARVSARATWLSDGTLRAGSLRVSGRSGRARLRAVVIRSESVRGRLLVSAGGTVLTIRTRASARRTASRGHRPGDAIVATVALSGSAATATGTVTIGHVAAVRLEGILTELSPTAIRLLVARAGFVTVAVPAGTALPAGLKVFDPVELRVAIRADGSFTLLAIADDDAAAVEDDDEDDDDEVEVKGKVTALGAGSITVAPRSGRAPVTCSLRAGTTLRGVTVGDLVEMKCVSSGASLVLVRLKLEDEHADEGDHRDDDHGGDHGDDDDGDHGGGGGHGDDDGNDDD
ncbi:MAG TPA: hypothetical protein VLB86_01950 [Gaiellaceae bacterium]|nr:hypothetical protein [Gaiellaceae bacterium]